MTVDFARVTELAAAYFKKLDDDVDRLCHSRESKVSELPSWFLVHRKITIGYIVDAKVFTIRAIPDGDLKGDEIETVEIRSQVEYGAATSPIPLQLTYPFVNSGIWIGDPRVVKQGDPFTAPVFAPPGLLGAVSNDETLERFLSLDAAGESALNAWQRAEFGLDRDGESAHHQMQQIFNRFSGLIRRKSFLERRIHRFLDGHRRVMLPAHKRCFFEVTLTRGEERKVADFILERETGMPALLIELESPHLPLFKQNGEYTANANHAREQIRSWVEFIDDYPANRGGDLTFLGGEKDRLVVQGEHLQHREQMESSKRSDTTMWTYDMLLQEAKERCHAELTSLHSMAGRDPIEVSKFA